MKFTKKEKDWLESFKNTMAAAPKSLESKISSYTVGDNDIVIFDCQKSDCYEDSLTTRSVKDKSLIVEESGSEILRVNLPFLVESTAG